MSDRRENAIFMAEITERLVDLSARVRYRDLPQEVVSKGKECIKEEKVHESVKKILGFEKLRDVGELIASVTVG